MSRLLVAAVFWISCASLRADDPPAKDTRPMRLLPGAQADGAIRLHNQWAIRPAGKQLELGDFPVNIALHPSGQWLAVLHAGYRDHEIIVVELDPKRQRITSRALIDQTFCGLCFDPEGKTLYASGGEFDLVHSFRFEDGYLTQPRKLPIAAKQKFIVSGLAVDPAGKTLCAAGVWGHGVCLISLAKPADQAIVHLTEGSYPYACLVDKAGKRLYVSQWNQASVAIVDLEEKRAT